jgi:hypothetical protein
LEDGEARVPGAEAGRGGGQLVVAGAEDAGEQAPEAEVHEERRVREAGPPEQAALDQAAGDPGELLQFDHFKTPARPAGRGGSESSRVTLGPRAARSSEKPAGAGL